ncbi:MAG: ATP synthase F1 subunit epsilon [Clostridiaceae bacterium]|mgnify:FL=1|nr:ATP synthase F1 subunit epsilon [Clostridiaceae bacterium]
MSETTPAKQPLLAEVVTPYGLLYDGPVEMVVMTAKDGEIGILPGHAPVFVALTPGEIRLKVDGTWRAMAATNGYAEIGPEMVIIIVNAAEWADQIDLPRAKAALSRAESKYHDPESSSMEKKHARHGIERAKARICVFEKYNP